jgi:carbonic anhydrase
MKRFVAGIRKFHAAREGEDFISKDLVAAQTPEVLVVTCSDSRVVLESVSDNEPGRIFIVRNAGNILPPAGMGSSEEGTIAYGVSVLKIKHLVICGHTNCGAMAGLFDPQIANLEPAVLAWVAQARSVRERVQERGGTVQDAIYENVLVQLDRARSYPSIRAALEAGELELHGWVYDIKTARFSRWNGHTFVDLLDDLPTGAA